MGVAVRIATQRIQTTRENVFLNKLAEDNSRSEEEDRHKLGERKLIEMETWEVRKEKPFELRKSVRLH